MQILIFIEPFTHISFDICQYMFRIYNILGEVVKTFREDPVKLQNYEFTWDGTDETGNTVSNGIYFCILSTNQNKLIYKIIKYCN